MQSTQAQYEQTVTTTCYQELLGLSETLENLQIDLYALANRRNLTQTNPDDRSMHAQHASFLQILTSIRNHMRSAGSATYLIKNSIRNTSVNEIMKSSVIILCTCVDGNNAKLENELLPFLRTSVPEALQRYVQEASTLAMAAGIESMYLQSIAGHLSQTFWAQIINTRAIPTQETRAHVNIQERGTQNRAHVNTQERGTQTRAHVDTQERGMQTRTDVDTQERGTQTRAHVDTQESEMLVTQNQARKRKAEPQSLEDEPVSRKRKNDIQPPVVAESACEPDTTLSSAMVSSAESEVGMFPKWCNIL